MARIPMTNGFVVIPEGNHIFRIYDASYDEAFGKIKVKLVNAKGLTHEERFSIRTKENEINDRALNAFSYFAKTALDDFSVEDIDITDIIGHYIGAEVVHTAMESNKTPGKMLTFVNLGDKWVAHEFDTIPVARAVTLGTSENVTKQAEQANEMSTKTSALDIDALLG